MVNKFAIAVVLTFRLAVCLIGLGLGLLVVEVLVHDTTPSCVPASCDGAKKFGGSPTVSTKHTTIKKTQWLCALSPQEVFFLTPGDLGTMYWGKEYEIDLWDCSNMTAYLYLVGVANNKPARIVVENDPNGQYAHTWPEFWIDGEWVAVESVSILVKGAQDLGNREGHIFYYSLEAAQEVYDSQEWSVVTTCDR